MLNQSVIAPMVPLSRAVGEPVTELVTRLRTQDKGGSRLTTNTYIVRSPSSFRIVVIDPDLRSGAAIQSIRRLGLVELTLLTHPQDDVDALTRWAAETGAPIRSVDPAQCRRDGRLSDGEQIHAAGCDIRVVIPAEHEVDQAAFYLPRDRSLDDPLSISSMITGDVVPVPPVSAQAGLSDRRRRSLERFLAFGPATMLPRTGDVFADLVALCRLGLDAVSDVARSSRRNPLRSPSILSAISGAPDAERVLDGLG